MVLISKLSIDHTHMYLYIKQRGDIKPGMGGRKKKGMWVKGVGGFFFPHFLYQIFRDFMIWMINDEGSWNPVFVWMSGGNWLWVQHHCDGVEHFKGCCTSYNRYSQGEKGEGGSGSVSIWDSLFGDIIVTWTWFLSCVVCVVLLFNVMWTPGFTNNIFFPLQVSVGCIHLCMLTCFYVLMCLCTFKKTCLPVPR